MACAGSVPRPPARPEADPNAEYGVSHRLPIDFTPEPDGCFLNASELEGWEDSRYAEGWAKGPTDKDFTPHAWLVMPDGSIIDPTWTDANGSFVYVEGDPHAPAPVAKTMGGPGSTDQDRPDDHAWSLKFVGDADEAFVRTHPSFERAEWFNTLICNACGRKCW